MSSLPGFFRYLDCAYPEGRAFVIQRLNSLPALSSLDMPPEGLDYQAIEYYGLVWGIFRRGMVGLPLPGNFGMLSLPAVNKSLAGNDWLRQHSAAALPIALVDGPGFLFINKGKELSPVIRKDISNSKASFVAPSIDVMFTAIACAIEEGLFMKRNVGGWSESDACKAEAAYREVIGCDCRAPW